MKHSRFWTGLSIGCVGVYLALVSFFSDLLKPHADFVLFFWTLAPPLWFWVEYVWLVSEEEKSDTLKLARVVHGQGLASRIWLAVLAILGALFAARGWVGSSVWDIGANV